MYAFPNVGISETCVFLQPVVNLFNGIFTYAILKYSVLSLTGFLTKQVRYVI